MNQPQPVKAPFSKATNLAFEVPEVTIDNFLTVITEVVNSTLTHWATFNYSKICFIQGTRVLTDPEGYTRVGLLFVNKEQLAESKEEGVGNNVYRYKWMKFSNPKLADMAKVQISHTLALALCDATPILWNAVSVGAGLIVIAPTVAIQKYIEKGINGTN